MNQSKKRSYESELDLEQLHEGFRCFWRDACRGDVPTHLWEELEKVAVTLDERLVELANNHGRLDRPEDEYAAYIYYYNDGFKGEIQAASMNVDILDCPTPAPEDYAGNSPVPECEWWDYWSVQ